MITSFFCFQAAGVEQSQKIGEGDSEGLFLKISRLASLYVENCNRDFEQDGAVIFENFQKLFSDKYTQEELTKQKDISYTPFNCLPDWTKDSLLKAVHTQFLEKFLIEEELENITNPDIKKALMFMSHDIRAAQSSIKTKEKDWGKVLHSVGKIYIVMNDTQLNSRELLGSGTGTLVDNGGKKFILGSVKISI